MTLLRNCALTCLARRLGVMAWNAQHFLVVVGIAAALPERGDVVDWAAEGSPTVALAFLAETAVTCPDAVTVAHACRPALTLDRVRSLHWKHGDPARR